MTFLFDLNGEWTEKLYSHPLTFSISSDSDSMFSTCPSGTEKQ